MTAVKIAPNTTPRPKAEIRTVTPTTAKGWLKQNKRNRPLVPNIVAGYARDMAAGHWQLTGEAIKFDTDGNLADGQHRLSAIVAANVAIDMLVVRNVLPETQTVMDSGRKRTASDALTLVGQKNPSILAAAARFALREPGCGYIGTEERVSNPTNSEIAEFIDGHPDIHRAADLASHYYPQFDAPPSVLAICWMRFSKVDLEAASLFFNSVANMATDGYGDPRAALVKRLANIRRNNERMTQAAYLSLIFRAWNAWRGGQNLGKLMSESRAGAVKIPERLR
jgi:hypothetical protein